MYEVIELRNKARDHEVKSLRLENQHRRSINPERMLGIAADHMILAMGFHAMADRLESPPQRALQPRAVGNQLSGEGAGYEQQNQR